MRAGKEVRRQQSKRYQEKMTGKELEVVFEEKNGRRKGVRVTMTKGF